MKTTGNRSRTYTLKAFLFFEIVTLAAGILGGLIGGTAGYSALVKPPLTPPSFVFPVVWTALYLMMGYAAYLVWDAKDIDSGRVLRLYLFHLLVNVLWPLFFFRLRWRLFAFFWVILLILVASLVMNGFKYIRKSAFRLMLPYYLWLFYAAYLNLGFYLFNT